LNAWWVPHGIFYWFMVYMLIVFIGKGFWYLLYHGTISLWFLWLAVAASIVVQQLLGLRFPKKFPSH